MNTTYQGNHDESAAMSIDLMPYLNALIGARWWLLAAALVSGVATGIWAYSKPYMYQSGVKVNVVDISDPGGVAPDDRRASEVLTLVEHGFVLGSTGDNYAQVMQARLVSRDFTMRFLEKANVYRFFYPELWSEEKQQWREGFTPDVGESFTRFRDEMRNLVDDEETGILTLKISWQDPLVARDLANQYVEEFNEFMRERTQEDVRRKQAFLHEELRRSDILEIQQSLYRLIEAQTAIAMLASARKEYALEIIDPAATPYKSFSMSRKRKVLLGMVAGVFLCISAVFARVLVSGLLTTLTRYRNLENKDPALGNTPMKFQNGEH